MKSFKHKLKTSVLLLCLMSGSFFLNAQVYTTDTGFAKVEGTTSTSSYTGKSRQLHGTINVSDSTVKFYLPLKTLKTGNGMRDRHMRNTLEADKYPKAIFSGRIVNKLPSNGNSKKVRVKGEFTIHGITRQIVINGKVSRQREQLIVEASFPVKITEYEMERPGFLFMTVNDKHEITVRATLRSKTP